MTTYRVTLKSDPSIVRTIRRDGVEVYLLVDGMWVEDGWAFGLMVNEDFCSNWQWDFEEIE